MPKNPTLKDKVKVYEQFLHKINMACLCGDNLAIQELVQNADAWSYAHRQGNGELSDKRQQELINTKFWKLLHTPQADMVRETMREKRNQLKVIRL